MIRHLLLTAALASLMTVGVVAAPASGQMDVKPLVLTPSNTVILNGSDYAGAYLQYALLQCVAKTPDAADYEPGSQAKPDRKASKAFPLYPLKDAAQIPKDKNIIAVGWTDYLSAADREKLGANRGGVLMRREGNVIVVASTRINRWRDPIAAVGTFLDQVAGVRTYAPDPLWWSGPDDAQITVGQLDTFIKPIMDKATWGGAWYKNFPKTWHLLTQPVSRVVDLRANHTLALYFKPEKYYDKHPRIYEMKDGARQRPQGGAWNPCLSAPMLPDIAMQEVREIMKKKPNSGYLSFGVMDTHFDCHGPECQASVKEHNGSYSNLYYTFLNKVAKQVKKEFPDLLLTSYVYANVRQPPVDMRIESNIVLDIVTKSYEWVGQEGVETEKEEILVWAGLGASWIAHDWSFAGISPRNYEWTYAHFVQWGRQNGMRGVYTEWSCSDNWYLDGPKYWIMRKLQADPYQNVDQLKKQYCDDMYGPASETMFRLYQTFSDKFVYSDDYIARRDWPRREMAMYTEQDLAVQRELIDTAVAQAGNDGDIQKRLAIFKTRFRSHDLFAQAVGEPGRISHQFSGKEMRRKALAFYANDDGSKLQKALEYYNSPEAKSPDFAMGPNSKNALPESASATYARGLGDSIKHIKAEALSAVSLDSPSPQVVDAFLSKAKQILHDDLPDNADPKQVRKLEIILEKIALLPNGSKLPEFDGDLSDSAWDAAMPLTDFVIRDVMQPSKHTSVGKMMRVGDHLVIGLVLHQDGPIWAKTPPEIETGTRIWHESAVEIFFGPPSPKGGNADPSAQPPYAQYIFNAFGAWRGFSTAAGNREGVHSAVVLDKDKGSFTLEIAIPLAAGSYDYSDVPALTFNIVRDVYTSDSFTADELIGWAPIYYSGTYEESRSLLLTQP